MPCRTPLPSCVSWALLLSCWVYTSLSAPSMAPTSVSHCCGSEAVVRQRDHDVNDLWLRLWSQGGGQDDGDDYSGKKKSHKHRDEEGYGGDQANQDTGGDQGYGVWLHTCCSVMSAISIGLAHHPHTGMHVAEHAMCVVHCLLAALATAECT